MYVQINNIIIKKYCIYIQAHSFKVKTGLCSTGSCTVYINTFFLKAQGEFNVITLNKNDKGWK